MKRIRLITTLLFCAALCGCKKDKDIPAPMTKPEWELVDIAGYPVSMTAVVRLPNELMSNLQPTDQLGAFIRGECRGLGVPVEVGETTLYFVLIHGTSTELEEIGFEYYSTKSSYLYKTGAFLAFKVDGTWGTVNSPKTLNLQLAK